MVQDAVLLENTQHELRHSVNRRKRKLQEIYRVTCATDDAIRRLTSNVPRSLLNTKPIAESDFLDANDIEKGRFFNVAILRRLPGADQLSQPDAAPLAPHSHGDGSIKTPAPSSKATAVNPPESVDVARTKKEDSAEALSPGQASAIKPRSPVSPAPNDGSDVKGILSLESEGNRHDAKSNQKGDSNTFSAARLAGLSTKNGTPATPPADGTERVDQDKENAFNLDATSKKVLPPNQEHTNSGPESQLLFEAAQSQTRASGLPSPSHASDDVSKSAGPTPSSDLKPGADGPVTIDGAQTGLKTPSRTAEGSPKPMQRPPPIDTSITRPQVSASRGYASAASTPPVSAYPGQTSPPERPRTRVSSGAIRHKSVSEILGETPRTASHDRTPSLDKTNFSPAASSPTSRRLSQASATLDNGASGRRLSDLRDKDKAWGQHSTVVFTKPPAEQQNGHARNSLHARKGPYDGIDDYLLPLFLAQASGHQELMQLINSSRKSLSTADFHLYIRELMNCRLLKKIYLMQNDGKWSLRQLEREAEPERPATHWDALLAEMKWMRTDFREERKWKLAVARNLALACADWVAASENERKSMQVKVSKPKASDKMDGITPQSAPEAVQDSEDSMPELVSSHEDDTSEDSEEELRSSPIVALPPSAVFSLGSEDVSFGIEPTPVGEKLLSELPLYDPFTALDKRSKGVQASGVDGWWRKSLTTVSRWNDSRIVYQEQSPRKRRKTSRYDYAADPEPEEAQSALPPEEDDVAMFRPENRHLMHRLHQTHAFRMPSGSEYPLPSQAFFEYRQSSQWTREDDEQLRRRVREYAFNWPLISQVMSSHSQYTSGAERRTPWECFERWEGMEGIPQEYSKYEPFKRWQSRKHNAEQRQDEQYQAQQQAAASAPHFQPRRRTGKPISVERRKSNKYVGLFVAMSKYAKKKEAQLAKQQQMASVAAMRKHAEPQQNTKRMSTPAEFSAHKHKQEQEMRDRQMIYRAQVAQRAAMAARGGNHMAGQQQSSMPNAQQIGRSSNMPAAASGSHSQVPSAATANNAAAGQNRLMPPGQGMLNAVMQNGARAGNVSQATNLQAYQRPNQTGGNDSARIMAEAGRLQEQQRLMAQNRQFPANVNGVSSHTMNAAMPQQNGSSFTNVQQQQTGKLSPAVNGQRPLSSPRVSSAAVQGQQLSSGVTPAISTITSELKKRHPNLSDAHISQMATQTLNMQLQNQRATSANSMHTASHNPQQQGSQQVQSTQQGGQASHVQGMQSGMGGSNGQYGGQMAQNAINAYSAAMRMQTQQQSSGQNANQHRSSTSSAGQGSTPRPESRGLTATPQNRANTSTPASGISATSANAPSQSPRPSSAQTQTAGQ